MSYPDVQLPPPRPWWARALRKLGGIVLALLLTAVGCHVAKDVQATRKMEAALAELNTTDPGWQLQSIEAARARVPDEENSARLIVAAMKELPPNWPEGESPFERAKGLAPNERLPDVVIGRITEALAKGKKALEVSEQLADRPRGRHRLVIAKNPLDTLLNDQQASRSVGELWRYEALRRLQGGDVPGALRAARATFNAGRSIGDEPFPISQLIRTALTTLAADVVERVLGQAEASDTALASWQAIALEEDRVPSYRVGMRGERAGFVKLLRLISEGEVKLTSLSGPENKWDEVLYGWMYRHQARVALPRVVELHAQWQEAAAAPTEKQADLEAALESEIGPQSKNAPLVRVSLPAISKLGESHRRKHAVMRCLATALAVERYRLANKRWPERLQQLVPAYLEQVPSDPFDGAALRYRRTDEGVIVYSVGRDRQDNEGHRCDNPTADGCDIGVRLFNVERRRQPAPAPKEPE